MTSEAATRTPHAAQAVPTVSGRLAHFIHGLRFADLPPHVVELARLRLLDCLSTALPARGLPVPEAARGLALASRGEATLIGYGERVSAPDAAFVNATLVNGRSQDDFLEKSHAGAVSLPAALAVAEAERRSGAELLVAMIAGYEVTGRIHRGGPGMLPRFRASGVAGTVGAAAAAARALRLDVPQTMNALGIAACFAHGFGQGFLSGTMEVKLNVGMASRSGVAAALLAKGGATASPLAFEGDAGFYRAIANSVEHVAEATRDLGARFLIEDAVYKECPVCIFVQTPIALARAIAARIDPAAVERVVVRSPELTHTNPGFTNEAPFASHLQAAVSARFCVAAALLGRPVESYEFYDDPTDPEVLALAGRIDLVMRPEDRERVEVEVGLRGGETVRESAVEMDMLRPSKERVVAKFRRLAGPVPGIDAERVLEAVMRLETTEDVSAFTALLAARG